MFWKDRVVKGVNFVNLRDAGDPVEQAMIYDREGADELVFLDITASHEARATMLEMVRRVADSIFIPYCVGGGNSNNRGHPRDAARGRGQSLNQQRGGSRSGVDFSGRLGLWQPMHRSCD